MDHTVRSGKADWDSIPASSRTYWQQLAVKTNGYATPGNAVTIVGTVISLIGLVEIYHAALTLGLLLVVIGRLADIADGAVADRTGTKSPLGEVLDASCDKAVAIAAFVVLLIAHTIPWLPLALIFIHTIINMTAGLTVKFRHLPFHPSVIGKQAVAAEWFAIFWFILAKIAVQHHALATTSLVVAYIGIIAFVAWGFPSSLDYTRSAFSAKPQGK